MHDGDQELLPPLEDWIPGALPLVETMALTASLHVGMRAAQVFPTGVLFRIAAMFPGELDLAAQRALAGQVMAYKHDGDAHTGPRLHHGTTPEAVLDSFSPEAMAWAHGGHRRLWTMGFWVQADVAATAELRCLLTWVDQGVHCEFGYTGRHLLAGLAGARRPWPVAG